MKGVRHLRVVVIALLATSSPAPAQSRSPAAANACSVLAPEAASRSGLSVDIVLRVMIAESGGNPRIVSPKGAMGCMQIMPSTWLYLRSRYNLGSDPFDARRNMIGGALYLAELVARYGMPGALAAYNAGPGRYERYAAGTATLPVETINYTRRIGGGASAPLAVPVAARWQEAGLFLPRRAPAARTIPSLPAAPGDAPGSRASLFPLVASVGEGAAEPVGP